MSDEHSRNELAVLRAELAAQRVVLASQQARLERLERPRPRMPRRFLPLVLAALLVTLVPLATLAASPFTDLTGGVHDANIGLLYDAGITTGCVPNVSYCPMDNVTRQEMASFLARTAGLGTNPPVVNARTAQTATNATNATHAGSADTATNATTATSAGNRTTVGGYAPSGLVRASRATGFVTTATNNPVVVLTLAITAPAAGVAVVTVGLRGDALNGVGACPCKGALGLHHVQTDNDAPTGTVVAIASSTDPGANADGTSLSYAFPVGAGMNTFQVVGFRSAGTATLNFYGQGTVIYVPFGGTRGAGAFDQDAPAPVASPTKP